MRPKKVLLPAEKLTVTSLLIATAGVIIQIVSGMPYPPVPPVFFMLLVPAALICFGKRSWPLLLAVAVGIFLTAGLFMSGVWVRLFGYKNTGGPLGLWIQTIAEAIAGVAAAVAFIQLSSKRAALASRHKK